MYDSSADHGDTYRRNQDADAFFYANSVGRCSNHVMPSCQTHQPISRTSLHSLASDQLIPLSMHDISPDNNESQFIHQMPNSLMGMMVAAYSNGVGIRENIS